MCDCPLGRFTNGTGTLVCIECDVGRFSNNPDVSSCVPCPQGTLPTSRVCRRANCALQELRLETLVRNNVHRAMWELPMLVRALSFATFVRTVGFRPAVVRRVENVRGSFQQ